MRWSKWAALALAACVEAQSSSTSTTSRVTVTQIVTESVNSILTVTVTTTLTVTNGGSSTSASIITPSNTVTPSSTSTTSDSSSTSSSVTTSISSSSSTSSSTATSSGPIVTDEAYIDTILRHHNVHRANHSANALTWSPSLGETAKKIASSCIYQHETTTDGGGYGQNIAAGFTSDLMGAMVTEGFYNSEVNSYTYYGAEPNLDTSDQWGHFTQIVWKSTTSVGCYTYDCTAQGLQKTDANIPPFFTVCNYAPAGNVVTTFAPNVGAPLGAPTINGGYECPSMSNCVGPTS